MQNELDRASCSDCLASAARRTSEKITDATRPRLRTTLAVLLGNERQYTRVSQSWSHDQQTLVVQCGCCCCWSWSDVTCKRNSSLFSAIHHLQTRSFTFRRTRRRIHLSTWSRHSTRRRPFVSRGSDPSLSRSLSLGKSRIRSDFADALVSSCAEADRTAADASHV